MFTSISLGFSSLPSFTTSHSLFTKKTLLRPKIQYDDLDPRAINSQTFKSFVFWQPFDTFQDDKNLGIESIEMSLLNSN
jgi:hypothetical protein